MSAQCEIRDWCSFWGIAVKWFRFLRMTLRSLASFFSHKLAIAVLICPSADHIPLPRVESRRRRLAQSAQTFPALSPRIPSIRSGDLMNCSRSSPRQSSGFQRQRRRNSGRRAGIIHHRSFAGTWWWNCGGLVTVASRIHDGCQLTNEVVRWWLWDLDFKRKNLNILKLTPERIHGSLFDG